MTQCEWKVRDVAARGDCFFECIALALESLGVESIRDMKGSAMRERARLCDYAEQHSEQAAIPATPRCWEFLCGVGVACGDARMLTPHPASSPPVPRAQVSDLLLAETAT